MDLEGQNSALESVVHNEAMTPPQDSPDLDKDKVGNNGSSAVLINNPVLDEGAKVEGIETTGSVDSPPPVKSSPIAKGFGLKKWRRIKREPHKDGDSSIDSTKLLKRGLSNSVANSEKSVLFSAGSIQKSNGSVSSTNALLRSPGVLVDGYGGIGDFGLDIGPTGRGGTDSENSEDRSSKSSTAASAPKVRYKASNVKNMGTSAQQAHQGKGRAETSKKPRGERIKIEKENSHSSMESDSRSSNFLFMQGNSHVTTNGATGGRSMNYDEEFSDEAQDIERPISEELQAGFDRRNNREFEYVSKEDLAAKSPWDDKEEKSENQGSSTVHDPLRESAFTLQNVQEQLEREVQNFKEIRIEEKCVGNEPQQCTDDDQRMLEDLFRQKIESEVEYLTIYRTIQERRAATVDQVTFFEEQTTLATEQAQTVKKVGDAESERYCDNDETSLLQLQKSVRKYSSYFLIQLVLLGAVVGLFLLHMSPDYVEVAPT